MVTNLVSKNLQLSIRPLVKTDAKAVINISETAGIGMFKHDEVLNYLETHEMHGKVALVACLGRQVIAYALTRMIPGLPDQQLLIIAVLPEHRRLKVASRLLQNLLQTLSQSHNPISRLIVRLSQEEHENRNFLKSNNFLHQHRDLHMELDNLNHIPPITIPSGMRLKNFQTGRDEATFVEYYSLAFADRPRFQPFTISDVISEENENFQPGDIMLLETTNQQPVGFVWSIIWKYPGRTVVQIEPMGVTPAFRGQNLGKLLLYMGLDYGRKRGAIAAELWTAEDNNVAVNLYTKTGFKAVGGFDYYYLPILQPADKV